MAQKGDRKIFDAKTMENRHQNPQPNPRRVHGKNKEEVKLADGVVWAHGAPRGCGLCLPFPLSCLGPPYQVGIVVQSANAFPLAGALRHLYLALEENGLQQAPSFICAYNYVRWLYPLSAAGIVYVNFELFFYSSLPEFEVHLSWFCLCDYENVYVA